MRTDRPARQSGGLREAQRRFTRQHILDAATEVFVERGYIASTVEDIIERAGTSRRTFYAHFRSKTQVLLEISTTLLPGFQDSYRKLDEALQAGSRESLRAWILSTIERSERHGGLMPVWQQAAAMEPEFEAQRRELVDGLPELMPGYFGRWPTVHLEEVRLRIVLLSVQLDRFFAYSPPSDMSASQRALVAEVLTSIWYAALDQPPGAAIEPTPLAPGAPSDAGVEPSVSTT